MKVLITGWSGTGKTTLAKEFSHRGLNAFDADRVPGLSGWYSKQTGEWAAPTMPADYSIEKYVWNWDKNVLHKFLDDNEDVILCGNAMNAQQFYPLFDQVLLLDLPEAEQRRRMMSRTEHKYGQDIAVQDMVIAQQAEAGRTAAEQGVTVIDASGTVEQTADTIIELANSED